VGKAFSRLGLLGNPSDGYGGKAIGCPVRNFVARVSLAPSDCVSVSAGGSPLRFGDLEQALEGPMPRGVEGLERLILAALRRLDRSVGRRRAARGPLAIECTTTIPRQVGLAGSSAVIIATIRAFCERWRVPIDPFGLAEMALATEVEDLGIAAGPMDRVIQAYDRVMVMDLAAPRSEESYQPLDAALLPPLLIAWVPGGGASSHVTHSDLRERFDRGEEGVVRIMTTLRGLVDQGVAALRARDQDGFADLMEENFRLRRAVTKVSEQDQAMVSIAGEHGAAAKLCGSGGAVVIVPRTGVVLSRVARALESEGFRACTPRVC
jgi:glucuronokinase